MEPRDILYLTLAFAVLVATAFWIAVMWYLVRILRSIEHLVGDFRRRLSTIDEILTTIKEKVTTTHIQIAAVAEGVSQLLNFVMNRRKRRTGTRASTAADDI